jgi:hypothetical protein
LEMLEFGPMNSNCDPFLSCAITGKNEDNAAVAKIAKKVSKRFGNIRS